MQPAAVPNAGPTKFLVAGAGMALGAAGSLLADRTFAAPNVAQAVKERTGTDMVSSSQAKVYGMAGAFAVGGGVSLGLAKHGGSAGFTTATFLAGNALLSTVAGAAVNASTDKADNYLASVGIMSTLVGAGALLGVRDELERLPVRGFGLGMLAMAAGFAAPTAVRAVAAIPSHARTGYEYRPGTELAETGARP